MKRCCSPSSCLAGYWSRDKAEEPWQLEQAVGCRQCQGRGPHKEQIQLDFGAFVPSVFKQGCPVPAPGCRGDQEGAAKPERDSWWQLCLHKMRLSCGACLQQEPFRLLLFYILRAFVFRRNKGEWM